MAGYSANRNCSARRGTAAFLIIILGATSPKAPAGFAPIAIGLGLTLIHLISIPVTNTSVNPAHSTAVAFFAETGALGQLWLFWVAPLAGAAIGALLWVGLLASRTKLDDFCAARSGPIPPPPWPSFPPPFSARNTSPR